MPTVNFSIPEDIKNAFNTACEGQNKNPVVIGLMRDAVEREQRRKQHCSVVDRILANRTNAPRFSEASSGQPAKMVALDVCGRCQRGHQMVC